MKRYLSSCSVQLLAQAIGVQASWDARKCTVLSVQKGSVGLIMSDESASRVLVYTALPFAFHEVK